MSIRKHASRHNKARWKILFLLTILIFSLTIIDSAYSLWSEKLKVKGTITMGKWKSCVKIRKSLDGAFTNPETGETLPIEAPNRTHIAVAASWPTKFILKICVENCGSLDLHDVVVTDTVKNTVGVTSLDWTQGEATALPRETGNPGEFGFTDITWDVGTLHDGDSACLSIGIETLPNNKGKYEPTSGDEGDYQYIEINEGATVTAHSEFNGLTATTDPIVLYVEDDDEMDNGVALMWVIVDDTLIGLPYETPWAKQSKSSVQ